LSYGVIKKAEENSFGEMLRRMKSSSSKLVGFLELPCFTENGKNSFGL